MMGGVVMHVLRIDPFAVIILGIVSIPGLAPAQNRNPMKTPVVYRVPGMDSAVVRSNVVFDNTAATPLALDAYLPRGLRKGERRPAIVFISGGERVRQWTWFITWGQLAAAHGLIGIIPDKRYPRSFEGVRTGFEDTEKLLAFLQTQGEDLGVDPQRICLWTFSAGGRLTSVGLQPSKLGGSGGNQQSGSVRCLVSFYGVLDMAAELQNISNQAERESLLKRYSPVQALESLAASGVKPPSMFIARAGKDVAIINNTLDRFVSTALRSNVSMTFVNYADGDHGFDGFNDTPQSRAIIKAALEFVKEQTGVR